MQEVPANEDILEGEIASQDVPRRGTLLWVLAQGVVEHDGVQVPACNRIPATATLATLEEGDRFCRVITDDRRCRARSAGGLGLCAGHAGVGGALDLDAMRKASADHRATVKMTRQVLGIGGKRSLDPRSAARLRASLRASDLAKAVVDGPLDDQKLGSAERQRAALSALDATFPLQTVTAELSLSDDPDSMSWKDMQKLAVSLLG